MRRRAELEAQTRLRITESAVALHSTLGPARTSISAIASHAGVRRSTVYRHFPDEVTLFGACSSHWAAANPVPDLAGWAGISDPDRRLRRALRELYAFYRRAQPMLDNVLRDEPMVPVLTPLLDGYRSYLGAARGTLMRGRAGSGRARRRLRAALGHALAFGTWRSLTMEGLTDDQAAEMMAGLVRMAEAGTSPRIGGSGVAGPWPPRHRPEGAAGA